MKALFYILGVLAYTFGFMTLSGSKSAFQEGVAMNILLVGTLFIVGAGIIGAIHSLKATQETNEG